MSINIFRIISCVEFLCAGVECLCDISLLSSSRYFVRHLFLYIPVQSFCVCGIFARHLLVPFHHRFHASGSSANPPVHLLTYIFRRRCWNRVFPSRLEIFDRQHGRRRLIDHCCCYSIDLMATFSSYFVNEAL